MFHKVLRPWNMWNIFLTTCTYARNPHHSVMIVVHMIVGTHISKGSKGGGRSPRGESKAFHPYIPVPLLVVYIFASSIDCIVCDS